VSVSHGSIFTQSIELGLTQITVSFLVNLGITLSAASLARWFAQNPRWLALQRYVMGTVLAGLALKLVTEQRKL
jgi:threonine/homoserine/homoserine lactone efflux protein